MLPISTMPRAIFADRHPPAMRPSAFFAAGLCALEAYDVRQLGPVDRVVPALTWTDRHDDSMSHRRTEQKRKNRLGDECVIKAVAR